MSTAIASPIVSEEQAERLIPRFALWPLSADDFQAMLDHGVVLEGDPVELVDGYLVRNNATARLPQLDELSTWCDVEAEAGVQRLPIWRLSVHQYEELERIGVLQSGDKCELIEGLLVRRMTTNTGHVIASHRVRTLVERCLPEGCHLRVQDPILLHESEPEPDVSVIRGRPEDYLEDHPGPADVLLVVEVSDSSLLFDQTKKLRAYASNHIPEYWIVNLIDRRLEIYRQPSGAVKNPNYRERIILDEDDQLDLIIDKKPLGMIRVVGLLPPSQPN
jgi:Uma2 family endonuclease